ncbi:hypothetical protein [Bryobacter aggregatus]|uniref:hypothetical protein n=1 Tax=Bryobacter aggregatus TaxID=360054 RepID=UPI0004E233B9|nr:hypothetical protein [Bryobacter aggregatus]
MEIQSIGLAGLEKAQEKLAAAAKRLSSAGNPAALSRGEDVVDLSDDMIAILAAGIGSQANLKAVESANELASRTIDLLG